MNKIEQIKAEKSGLDVGRDIPRYAALGWEAIEDGDLERLSVSAAVAVPAYAGIPLTDRGVASSFAVVTGHRDRECGSAPIRWDRLATSVDTIVVLMGARSLPDIAAELLRHGRAADTAIALIRWGTTAEQATVITSLGEIAATTAESLPPGPPLVAVIGDVVHLRETLAWFRPEHEPQNRFRRTADSPDPLLPLT